MYDYYLKTGAPNCKVGKIVRGHTCACSNFAERKAFAKATYGSIGDAALDAITDDSDRSQAVSEMAATITTKIAAVGANRNQMAHVPIQGRYAVDVAPSSIAVADHDRFRQAVEAHPSVITSRFFYPGKEGGPAETAFHIEFELP